MITLELPSQKSQTAANLRRWEELLADKDLAKVEGRIETDRYGRIIMCSLPDPSHGSLQGEIGHQLRTLLPRGRVISECPISTADGVKAADVAWASPERMEKLRGQACFSTAPEICVEVMSPGNSEREMQEKAQLYFDAGAKEVWLCNQEGEMRFLSREPGKPSRSSKLCPSFPKRVVLN